MRETRATREVAVRLARAAQETSGNHSQIFRQSVAAR